MTYRAGPVNQGLDSIPVLGLYQLQSLKLCLLSSSIVISPETIQKNLAKKTYKPKKKQVWKIVDLLGRITINKVLPCGISTTRHATVYHDQDLPGHHKQRASENTIKEGKFTQITLPVLASEQINEVFTSFILINLYPKKVFKIQNK